MKNKLMVAGIPVIAALLLTGGIAFAANGRDDGNRNQEHNSNNYGNTHSYNRPDTNGNGWRNGRNDGDNRNYGNNRNGDNDRSFNQFNGANWNWGNNGFYQRPFDSFNTPVVVNGYNGYYNTGISPFVGVNGTLLEEVLSQGLGVQNGVLVNAYNSNETLAELALQNRINQAQFEANLQALVSQGLISAGQYNALCSEGWNMPLGNIANIF